jgi:hypothetical protein
MLFFPRIFKKATKKFADKKKAVYLHRFLAMAP